MTGAFSLAVHALLYLNHKQASLSSEELANNICTNPVRVRKIMSQLKQAGFVATKEGSSGGYTLICDPSFITLSQIAKAIEVKFVDSNWHSGNENMDCLIASGMANIMDQLYTDLNEHCMEKLNQLTLLDIEQQIF